MLTYVRTRDSVASPGGCWRDQFHRSRRSAPRRGGERMRAVETACDRMRGCCRHRRRPPGRRRRRPGRRRPEPGHVQGSRRGRHQDRPDGRPAVQLRRLHQQRAADQHERGHADAAPEPDHHRPAGMPHGAAASSPTADCRRYRLGLLFDFLRSEGVTNVELFGHAGFPANGDIAGRAGLPRAARRLRPPRRRLARRHERGRLGRPHRRGEDPRRRLHRLRRLPRPWASAATPTRWRPPRRSTGSASGRSRPASARCTSTTTRRSSRTSTSTTAC